MKRSGFSLRVGAYLFAPSLWPSVAFFLVLPVLLSLGFWQMERATAKQALLEQRVAGGLQMPLDLNRVPTLTGQDRYRSAVVRGRYSDEQQWLLDNRVYRGQAGYHVFTPFIREGEVQPALLINRGWVSVGETREFLPQLPVPGGPVELSGRLDTPASVAIVMGEPPVGSVEARVRLQTLDIGALSAARGLALADLALVIDEGSPGGLQYDWSPVPQMGPEKHLGYAVQWFGLAVALTIIYVGVNTRRGGNGGGNHVRA